MPGIKHRTKRYNKRITPTATRRRGRKPRREPTEPTVRTETSPPPTSTVSPPSTVDPSSSTTPDTPANSTTAPQPPTASQKKIGKCPANDGTNDDSDSDAASTESELDTYDLYEGEGLRLLEVSGVQSALQGLCCKECGGGPILFKEDLSRRQGLCTNPYFYCDNCSVQISIPYSKVEPSRALIINRKSVLACKSAGDTLANLQMFCAMMDLPQPVSKNVYTEHLQVIAKEASTLAQTSLAKARKEVREHYGATGDDDVVDILVSCDGTWQKRGFKSLFGAVFVISFETGKVLDYRVKSKHCSGCSYWEKEDKTSQQYLNWKESHQCEINFEGSAGAMEPESTLEMFESSLQDNIRYTRLISDGDSKTHRLLIEQQPYGETLVEKCDCVGHVQKRMGTALRNLKTQYRGQKLSDGKSRQGRLTDGVINSLQNYYGDAIRRNQGDVAGMMRAVQATLLHYNSTDEAPRHHLCPTGKESWCKWQKARALGNEYHHSKNPLPEAIVILIKPIYARLGCKSLLEKCTGEFTQNANESLHSTVWKFCPKEVFQGRVGVELACALAVCSFNDGLSSLALLEGNLHLEPTPFCSQFLKNKDKKRLKSSVYKSSEGAKRKRRAVRRKRKGLDDKLTQKEGVMYASGAFDSDQPGPSKIPRNE